ncbi:MAG: NAD-dependent epimerase/dehydratase family protein [Deltaproteobacteria bacterium]|nr:NAD-dependent epimerase/dehydratase family protein [Deltaproteobacteria bacterium]
MHCLVTGSRGFLGRRLVAHLQRSGIAVREWGSDIREIAHFREAADVVVHLAAKVRTDQFAADREESFDVNVTGTQCVLDFCARVSARLVFASTSGVYRSTASPVPLTEAAPTDPASDYPLSKWLAERLIHVHASRVPSVILRIFNPYGPGQHPSFLIPQAMQCAKDGRLMIVRMPQAVRDFVYLDDVIAAIEAAIRFPERGCHTLNIGSGEGLRVETVLKRVGEVVGRPLSVERGTPHPGEVTTVVSDATRARMMLGWEPHTGLEQGLRAILEATDGH